MCDNVEYLFVPESNMPDRVLVGSINMSRNHGMVAYVPERTRTPVYRYFGETFPHSIHVTELSCGHEFRWYARGYTPNYCPDCGAKVVGR